MRATLHHHSLGVRIRRTVKKVEKPMRGGRRYGTVSGMTNWRIGNATLSFHIPTRASIEHAENRDSGRDATSWHPSFGKGHPGGPEAAFHSYDPYEYPGSYDGAVSVEHRIWWWYTAECAGGYECTCGPITLLEALERLEPSERGTAVRLHAEEMRALYDHFWSGQGLVSGACNNIGYACVSCISEGTDHVWDVYEDACVLAEEFGEALAAYAYELMVGEPRFYTPTRGEADSSGPL